MKANLSVFPIAPSSPFDLNKASRGVALLRARGMKVLHDPQRRELSPDYLNGSDELRLTELHEAMRSTSADLMWMARGGYGLSRILPSIELPSGPTPVLVGFSDTTALHCHLWRHKKQKGIHAPNLTGIGEEASDSLEFLWAILEGRVQRVEWPKLLKAWWPNNELVKGPLIVANLCVLTHLIGTTSMPCLDGCILVIEEVAERPYRIDRMLTQLWNSGSLNGVRAIVLGLFVGCEEKDEHAATAQSVVMERCKHFGIPLCQGLSVGHETPNWALPFGALASLMPSSEHVELRILEELF
jgi:muramoyltetrapeptide carboxypeptidase